MTTSLFSWHLLSLFALIHLVTGSGSTYIYGFCDAYFKPGMSKEQSEEFVTKGSICPSPVPPAGMERPFSRCGVFAAKKSFVS